MRVILGESPHPGQSVQDAAPLIPINGPPLGITNWKIPVGPNPALEYVYVERTVHRLQVELLLVDRHRSVHAVGVEVEVAAGLPQRRPPYVRRVNEIVTTFQVFCLAVFLDQIADQSSLGVPQNEAGADRLGIDAE